MGKEPLTLGITRCVVLAEELRRLPRAQRVRRLAELRRTLTKADLAYVTDMLAAPPLKPAKPAQPASDPETKRKATGAAKPAAPPAAKQALTPVAPEKRFLHWRVQPEGGPEYELTDYLGGGGMASVWRAEQRGSAKSTRWPSIAACKIPEHAASPKAAAEALKAEAKLLEEIDHPKVIKCIRPGVALPPKPVAPTSGIQFRPEQLPCYLMELPQDAMSFGKWLKQREARREAEPVKCDHHVAHVRLVLRIFRDIATTFSTLLSEHSLVHGDQSFGNVLIVPGRNPDNPDFRLIDLGCAQRVRNHMKVGGVEGYSEVEVCCGTLGFASPEQRPRHGRLHRTSDGFALGAMWFSAFAGKSAREMDELLFKPAPAGPGPDGQRTLSSLFRRVPAEELCAQLTRAICSHGLRQRLLQERERLLTILRDTLTDDVTQRLEMSALREEFDALEKALAKNHWDERVRGRPNTAINHPLFGREEDMAGVVEHFAATGEGPAIVLLTGLGGVGKTALCEAYIDRFHQDYDCILWSTATDEMTFLTSIAEFLVKLGLNRKGVPIEQQRTTFLSRISQPGVLWVINNLHDDSKGRNDWLAKWLPTEGTAHILINSRVVKSKIPGLAGEGTVLERRLKPLAEAAALDYLCDRAQRSKPTGEKLTREKLTRNELNFAKKLVSHEGLDGLPLGIELCGALLDAKANQEGRPMTFKECWERFHRDYTILDWHWEKAATELGRTGKEQLRRVAVVWRQLFELIQEQHPAAAALLRLSAVLPPDDIPVELLRRDVTWPDTALQAVLTIPDDAERDTALFKQLDVLAGHSLIDWNAKTKSWSIHRLVQLAVCSPLSVAECSAWCKSALLGPDAEIEWKITAIQAAIAGVNQWDDQSQSRSIDAERILRIGRFLFELIYVAKDEIAKCKPVSWRAEAISALCVVSKVGRKIGNIELSIAASRAAKDFLQFLGGLGSPLPEVEVLGSSICHSLGWSLHVAKQQVEAKSVCEEGIASIGNLAANLDSQQELLLNLFDLHLLLAQILEEVKDFAGALKNYLEAENLLGRASETPASIKRGLDLALDFSCFLKQQDRLAEARQILELALKWGEDLLGLTNNDPIWWHNIAQIHGVLATLNAQESRWKDCRRHCEASLELAARLVERDTLEAHFAGLLNGLKVLHGMTLAFTEDANQGLQEMENAYHSLKERFPESHGNAIMNDGRPLIAQAISIVKSASVATLTPVWTCFVNTFNAASKQFSAQDHLNARVGFEEARRIAGQHSSADPGKEHWKACLLMSFHALAELEIDAGNYPTAISFCEEAKQLTARLPKRVELPNGAFCEVQSSQFGLEYRLHATRSLWSAALLIAEEWIQILPEDINAWVLRAHASQQLGRIQTAFDQLLPAREKFPENPGVPYNLACYCSLLGQVAAAREWLVQAYALPGGEPLRAQAASDPDLAALRAD